MDNYIINIEVLDDMLSMGNYYAIDETFKIAHQYLDNGAVVIIKNNTPDQLPKIFHRFHTKEELEKWLERETILRSQ